MWLQRLTNLAGKVPKNETAFLLCRATDSLWNRKVVSLLSSVMAVVHLPIFCTSSMACWLRDPALSMATGKKMSFQVPDTLQSSCYIIIIIVIDLAVAPWRTMYLYCVVAVPCYRRTLKPADVWACLVWVCTRRSVTFVRCLSTTVRSMRSRLFTTISRAGREDLRSSTWGTTTMLSRWLHATTYLFALIMLHGWN